MMLRRFTELSPEVTSAVIAFLWRLIEKCNLEPMLYQLQVTRPPPPPTDGFSQLALKGQVRAYVPPDHRWGESFPGKQSPTLQLSLFEAGVKRVRTSVSST